MARRGPASDTRSGFSGAWRKDRRAWKRCQAAPPPAAGPTSGQGAAPAAVAQTASSPPSGAAPTVPAAAAPLAPPVDAKLAIFGSVGDAGFYYTVGRPGEQGRFGAPAGPAALSARRPLPFRDGQAVDAVVVDLPQRVAVLE
jgi:hypothetical protein